MSALFALQPQVSPESSDEYKRITFDEQNDTPICDDDDDDEIEIVEVDGERDDEEQQQASAGLMMLMPAGISRHQSSTPQVNITEPYLDEPPVEHGRLQKEIKTFLTFIKSKTKP